MLFLWHTSGDALGMFTSSPSWRGAPFRMLRHGGVVLWLVYTTLESLIKPTSFLTQETRR